MTIKGGTIESIPITKLPCFVIINHMQMLTKPTQYISCFLSAEVPQWLETSYVIYTTTQMDTLNKVENQIMVSMFPEEVLNKAKYKINIIFSLTSLPFPHSGKRVEIWPNNKVTIYLKFHPTLRVKFKFYFLHKGCFITIITNDFSISEHLHYYLYHRRLFYISSMSYSCLSIKSMH